MPGENLRDGIVEVAFEQWTQRQIMLLSRLRRVPALQGDDIGNVLYRMSAENIFLKLGGTADLFALSFTAWGVFICLENQHLRSPSGRRKTQIRRFYYMKQISGNRLLVNALKEEGVEVVFGYPGACTIDISDELYRQDQIAVVLPRHEQALAHEADAYARTTGKVGVCLVTSGPGATNLVTGLATANYDSVPLVCFTGQVAKNLIGNDAFQEVDIVGITRNITKYSVTVRNRADLHQRRILYCPHRKTRSGPCGSSKGCYG